MMLFLLQVTTTCIPMAGQITCTSNAPLQYRAPPPITQVDVGAAIRSLQRYRPVSEPEPITSFQHELMSRMRVLIQQRRCEDSFRLAALAGEPEIADSSRRVCPFQESAR